MTARVAEEADPRSAVSFALHANMGGWLGWLVSPLFSLLSFLDCRRPPVLLCDFYTLPHGLAPGWEVICLLLPSVKVNATQFEVSFAGVFVLEKRAASSSLALCQFTIQDVFGNAASFHRLSWPSQRRRLSLSMANILFILALLCTSVSGTLSSQWMWRMCHRYLMWKLFSIYSCFA